MSLVGIKLFKGSSMELHKQSAMQQEMDKDKRESICVFQGNLKVKGCTGSNFFETFMMAVWRKGYCKGG